MPRYWAVGAAALACCAFAVGWVRPLELHCFRRRGGRAGWLASEAFGCLPPVCPLKQAQQQSAPLDACLFLRGGTKTNGKKRKKADRQSTSHSVAAQAIKQGQNQKKEKKNKPLSPPKSIHLPWLVALKGPRFLAAVAGPPWLFFQAWPRPLFPPVACPPLCEPAEVRRYSSVASQPSAAIPACLFALLPAYCLLRGSLLPTTHCC